MNYSMIKYFTTLSFTLSGIAISLYFIFKHVLRRKIFLLQTMNDKEKAINIYLELTKLEHEAYEKNDCEIQKAKRINALKSNNEMEYNKLMKDFLADKYTFVYEKRDELLLAFKLSKTKYENIIDEISFIECEEKLYEIYQPKQDLNLHLSRIDIKKLIIEIANTIDNTLKTKAKDKKINREELNYFRLTQKQKMEDLLYDKYKLSFSQLKYLAFTNDIIRDEEIITSLQFLN